jgi:hypothetical protein
MPTECSPDFFGFEPVEGRAVVAALTSSSLSTSIRRPRLMERSSIMFQSAAVEKRITWQAEGDQQATQKAFCNHLALHPRPPAQDLC